LDFSQYTWEYTLYPVTNGNFSETPQLIALAIIVFSPVLLLFLIFQEKLMGNLTLGGLKG
jgi:ABC-type maltose transport system permease subunit